MSRITANSQVFDGMGDACERRKRGHRPARHLAVYRRAAAADMGQRDEEIGSSDSKFGVGSLLPRRSSTTLAQAYPRSSADCCHFGWVPGRLWVLHRSSLAWVTALARAVGRNPTERRARVDCGPSRVLDHDDRSGPWKGNVEFCGSRSHRSYRTDVRRGETRRTRWNLVTGRLWVWRRRVG